MSSDVVKSCAVCKEKTHQYKCPKCLTKYCSLSCYKTHQVDMCITPQLSDVTQISPPPSSNKESHAIKPSSTPEDLENICSDKVPADLLHKLGESSVVTEMLSNPHLAKMLTSLDSSSDPGAELDRAMQIPIFSEFATECLKIVK